MLRLKSKSQNRYFVNMLNLHSNMLRLKWYATFTPSEDRKYLHSNMLRLKSLWGLNKSSMFLFTFQYVKTKIGIFIFPQRPLEAKFTFQYVKTKMPNQNSWYWFYQYLHSNMLRLKYERKGIIKWNLKHLHSNMLRLKSFSFTSFI